MSRNNFSKDVESFNVKLLKKGFQVFSTFRKNRVTTVILFYKGDLKIEVTDNYFPKFRIMESKNISGEIFTLSSGLHRVTQYNSDRLISERIKNFQDKLKLLEGNEQ